MSYLPLQNEVIITGLNIVSGGTTWAGVTVVISVSAPGGNPITPAQFYVKSAADGSLIKVDLATAEQLYATSVAINDLNSFYDKLGAQYTPSQDWVPVVNNVQTVLNLKFLSSHLASSILDLLDPELTAPSIIGAASDLFAFAKDAGVAVLESLQRECVRWVFLTGTWLSLTPSGEARVLAIGLRSK